MLVRPEAAEAQMDAEKRVTENPIPSAGTPTDGGMPTASVSDGRAPLGGGSTAPEGDVRACPKRFHGTVRLDPGKVALDAGRIAEAVIAHLEGQVGARVSVTLEIEAELPDGAPEHVVRAVTENSATLKFEHHAFEVE